MITTREVRNVKVRQRPKPGKEFTKDGLPRRGRKIGKIFKTVFDPSGMRVVGYIVRRPDFLWMFKRPEKFLALDAYDAEEGVIHPTMGSKSWDDAAIKRLGIDFDKCLIWEGMDVVTTSGDELGRVDEISFDEETGEVGSFFLDDGGASRALIGSFEIPADLVIGYDPKKQVLRVKAEASNGKLTGGLAAKAGTAVGRAQASAKQGTKKADEVASQAVEKGSVGLGKAVGRLKRSMDESVVAFNDASGRTEEKARQEAAARKVAAAKPKAGTSKAASASGSAKAGAKKAAGPAGKKSSQGTGADMAKAVGKQLKGASTMFADFKSEFDKASKGK